MQNNIDDILGTLYDPEEILEQTETQKIKKIIEIFNKTGYENISIEYEKFIKNQKYDFTDLPAPEDISEDFKRRYLELLNNGEIYIT